MWCISQPVLSLSKTNLSMHWNRICVFWKPWTHRALEGFNIFPRNVKVFVFFLFFCLVAIKNTFFRTAQAKSYKVSYAWREIPYICTSLLLFCVKTHLSHMIAWSHLKTWSNYISFCSTFTYVFLCALLSVSPTETTVAIHEDWTLS